MFPIFALASSLLLAAPSVPSWDPLEVAPLDWTLTVHGRHSPRPLIVIDRGRASPVVIRPTITRPLQFVAHFVAAGGVLTSEGCGTYCETTLIYDRDGRRIASLGHHALSPRGRVAMTWSAWSGPVHSQVVDFIDLTTGKVLWSGPIPGAWNIGRVDWRIGRVILHARDDATPKIEFVWPADTPAPDW